VRRIPFLTVLNKTLGLAGHPASSATQAQKDMAADFISMRLRDAWGWGPWPELTPCELRRFADDYVAGQAVAAGELRWDETSETYYEALLLNDGSHGLDETAYWGALSGAPAPRTIAWEQNGKNKVGRVWRATRSEWRSTAAERQLSYDFFSGPDGVVVREAVDGCYLTFTLAPPTFTAVEFDATEANYAVGSLILYASEANASANLFPLRTEVYRRDYNRAGELAWVLVEFPAFMGNAVPLMAAADMLRFYGSREQALALEAMGKRELEVEWSRAERVI